MRRRLRLGALPCAVALALVLLTPARAAFAIQTGGPAPFGIAPGPVGSTAGYFQLALPPGGTAAQTVVVSNAGSTKETLRLGPSYGATAPNSGTSFVTKFGSCKAVGCWLSGLPPTVTLAAGTAASIPFTVAVPQNAAPKQYLAGITAEAATPPPPVTIGHNAHSAARAIIVRQASVAVAISVGSPLQLGTQMRIPGVTGDMVGQVPRLEIRVDNIGQTFVHANGSASCSSGTSPGPYVVTVSTVLPGDEATVPINAPGITPGSSVPCTVQLRYGNGPLATWSGEVDFPTTPPTTIVHTAPGAYSVISTGVPGWALALIVIGALVLAGLVALAVLLWRRGGGRRSPEDGPETNPPGDEEPVGASASTSPK